MNNPPPARHRRLAEFTLLCASLLVALPGCDSSTGSRDRASQETTTRDETGNRGSLDREIAEKRRELREKQELANATKEAMLAADSFQSSATFSAAARGERASTRNAQERDRLSKEWEQELKAVSKARKELEALEAKNGR